MKGTHRGEFGVEVRFCLFWSWSAFTELSAYDSCSFLREDRISLERFLNPSKNFRGDFDKEEAMLMMTAA